VLSIKPNKIVSKWLGQNVIFLTGLKLRHDYFYWI
jgi:hypothetical protein